MTEASSNDRYLGRREAARILRVKPDQITDEEAARILRTKIEFITVEEAARILRLTPMTIRIYIKHKKLPAVKFGHAVRIPYADFMRWLKKGLKGSAAWSMEKAQAKERKAQCTA